jgi:hypothetical protein
MRNFVVSLVGVAGVACAFVAPVSAQSPYSFEMRLVADGTADAPGLGAQYSIGNPAAVTATRIGFWLQARVAQTVNQNWGINRFSTPGATQGGGDAFVRVNDSLNQMSISRGTVDVAGTLYGRGTGYRFMDVANNNTNTGNSAGPNYENGFLNSAGPEGSANAITGIDSYMGAFRNSTPTDNPWGVNGGAASAPWPSDGTFAPWANLYRVWIDIYDFTAREVTVDARGLLNGAVQTQFIGGTFWPMQTNVPAGQVQASIFTLTTSTYSFSIVPTPGAAAGLGLAGLAALRRRR